ncbi:MAG: rRNA pseudouridine synthase [Deltaproteobacteria bacterium]|nr:rRNA pseudouridine synthase [Deltaproteobacteria bacterium]
MERIQKILARGGIASRRAAERLITEGRVRVNGRVITELGTKADPRKDRVEIDGKRVVAEQFVYVVLHKPRGVVATMSDPEGRPTVREILASVGARVYPVGRLDFATSGVLLATNDGDLADGLLHPRKAVPKTYVVKVKGKMEPEDVDVWRNGVRLEDGMTLPAEAKILRYEGDKTWIELTIREGKNQQIRRMGEATRFPVMRLARVSFADISGEGLRPGAWRHLTREELVALKKAYGVPRSIPAAPAVVPTGRRGRAVPSREVKPERDERDGRDRGGPRYGGGAPGRRGYDVKDDWGGGARRGASDGGRDRGERPADERRPHPGLGGGRGGRTRTTGTSGGIGTQRGGDRVKSRRG